MVVLTEKIMILDLGCATRSSAKSRQKQMLHWSHCSLQPDLSWSGMFRGIFLKKILFCKLCAKWMGYLDFGMVYFISVSRRGWSEDQKILGEIKALRLLRSSSYKFW